MVVISKLQATMASFVFSAGFALLLVPARWPQGHSRHSCKGTGIADFTRPPIIIAHRGASGIYPEHTAAAYHRAIEDGADFVECDVVPTRDCILICRHEPDLNLTTDAYKHYPEKVATYEIDGVRVTGIFSFDVTWTQIQALRAVQPRPYRNQLFNLRQPVLSLDQFLDLILTAGRAVGIYPETKHPSFFDSLQLPCFANTSFTEAVLAALESKGYGGPITSQRWLEKPIFIQSFERRNLQLLRHKTDIPLVQLLGELDQVIPYDSVSFGNLVENDGLKEVAKYTAAIGPAKEIYAPVNSSNYLAGVDKDFVARAHHAGLQVHSFTFRNEDRYLAWDYGGDIWNEYDLHFQELGVRYAASGVYPGLHSTLAGLGVDAAFTDFPGTLARYLKHTTSCCR